MTADDRSEPDLAELHDLWVNNAPLFESRLYDEGWGRFIEKTSHEATVEIVGQLVAMFETALTGATAQAAEDRGVLPTFTRLEVEALHTRVLDVIKLSTQAAADGLL